MTDIPAVNALEVAQSLEEAQFACSGLIDLALDGGSAVSDNAPIVLSELTKTASTHDFYAYFLAVFLEVARRIGVWQRTSTASTPNERVRQGVWAEKLCAHAVTGLAARAADQELPADPEIRCLTYRLWSVGLSASRDTAARLFRAIAEEQDPVAAACALEALVVVLARNSDVLPDDPIVSLLRDVIANGPDTFLDRATLAMHDWAGDGLESNRTRIEELLGRQLRNQAVRHWPSELM